MELYLAQHGKAKPEDEDARRPLSAEGREETARVARAAAAAGLGVEEIWHSGKLRARETAEILVSFLEPARGSQAKEGLGPLDDPRQAAEAVREAGGSVLLVGHLPHVSRLASLLLTGDSERTVVEIRFSGIVALGEEEERWVLRWYLRPELVPG